jgi:MFS family permease
MNREEKNIIRVTTSSHGLVHLFENVTPPLIPILTTVFTTDYFHLGLVVTIFSYAFGLGAIPGGLLADRLGPRRLVILYLFGSGIFSLCVGFADTLTAYAVVMGFVGVFCSVYHPASNTLISQRIREKGKAFGLHGIAGSIGVAAAPVLSAFVGLAAGWKSPHLLMGVFAIILGVYSLSLRPDSPASPPVGPSRSEEENPPKMPYLKLTFFFLGTLSLGLTYKGILTFLPTYMGQNVHIPGIHLSPVSMGGLIATIALISGALGQYLAGRFVDRYPPERLYLFVIAAAALFVFLMAMSTNALLVVSVILYSLFYFAGQPMQNFILSRYTPKHRQGIVYGFHFSLTFGVGSTSAAACGYVADRMGLAAVFYILGVCFVFAAFFILLLAIQSGREKGSQIHRLNPPEPGGRVE